MPFGQDVAVAIRDLAVRGAPVIGIAAAWGTVLAAMGSADPADLDAAMARLRAARPTAVNLMWALDRMQRVRRAGGDVAALAREAQAIQDEDLAANRRMGELGAADRPGSGAHPLQHRLARHGGFRHGAGRDPRRFCRQRTCACSPGETRPWQQGARLTLWELVRDGIPAKLIADSAAAHLMKSGAVQWVIVGADRIAANGDTANKIGTYQLAIAARHHGVKFMVVAPSSTVDMAARRFAISRSNCAIPANCCPSAAGAPWWKAQAWNPVFGRDSGRVHRRHRH